MCMSVGEFLYKICVNSTEKVFLHLFYSESFIVCITLCVHDIIHVDG